MDPDEYCCAAASLRYSGSRCCCHEDLDTVTEGEFYQTRYKQLMKEKQELEERYERERRERESVEAKNESEFHENEEHEQRLLDLNVTLQDYERELGSLRRENELLSCQFDQLRSTLYSGVGEGTGLTSTGYSSGLAAFVNGGATGHVDVSNVSAVSGSSGIVNGGSDMCSEEVLMLAKENEIFKEIVKTFEKQDRERGTWEGASPEYAKDIYVRQSSEENRLLSEENRTLKSRQRELEKKQREQESQLEDARLDAEDDARKMKKETSSLKDALQSKTRQLEDYQCQLLQVKSDFTAEVHDLEAKLENETSDRSDLQVQVHDLEKTIQSLENERKEMVVKLEKLYISENEILMSRNELEERYSREVHGLQLKLDEEIRSKVKLSQEMAVAVNEVVELRNHCSQVEEMHRREVEKARSRGAVGGGAAVSEMSMDNGVTMQHAHTSQHVTNQMNSQGAQQGLKQQLDNEMKKRKLLEEENKKLLYQMNGILSTSDANTTDNRDRRDGHVGAVRGLEEDDADQLKRKIRSLESKVAKLTEKNEELERDVRKRKDLENKNLELISEVNDLSQKKDEMERKHKALVKDADDSSETLRDLREKNRRLTTEVGVLSSRVRDMEDSFRQEKANLMRNCDREKSSEVNDLRRRKEDVERRLDDQMHANRRLEETIHDLKREISGLKTRDRDTSVSRSGVSERNDVGLKGKVEELEWLLQQGNQKHEEVLKSFDDQKRQLKEEFEQERISLLQRFEIEKQQLMAQLSGAPSSMQHRQQLNGNLSGHGVTTNAPQSFGRGRQPQISTVSAETTSVRQSTTLPLQAQRTLPGAENMTGRMDPQTVQTITNLQQEMRHLVSENQNMERRIQELESDSPQRGQVTSEGPREGEGRGERRRKEVHFKNDSFVKERKKNGDTLSDREDTTRSRRSDDDFSSGSGYFSSDEYHGSSRIPRQAKRLINSLRDNVRELRLQMKLQRESFDAERKELFLRVEGSEGGLTNEDKAKLLATIRGLKKEVHLLKHEKEHLVQKLRRERKLSYQEEEHREEVSKIRKEMESRIQEEKKKSRHVIESLNRKIQIYENQVREMDVKFKNDVKVLEERNLQEKLQLERSIRGAEEKMRLQLELQHKQVLKTQKQKYEETFNELKREVSSLKEHRKQIQTKVLSSEMSNIESALRTSVKKKDQVRYSQNNLYGKLDRENSGLHLNEIQLFKENIEDLQREVNELRKEKSDIKTSYKQEKEELVAEFEREKSRMEERYRREKESWKSQLELTTGGTSLNASAKIPRRQLSIDSRGPSSREALMRQENTALEIKNSHLEGDIIALKRRLSNLEDRQMHVLELQDNKSQKNTRNISSLGRSVSYSELPSASGLQRHGSTQHGGSNLHRSTTGLSLLNRSYDSGSSGLARNHDLIHSSSAGILERGSDLSGQHLGLSSTVGTSGRIYGMSGGSVYNHGNGNHGSGRFGMGSAHFSRGISAQSMGSFEGSGKGGVYGLSSVSRGTTLASERKSGYGATHTGLRAGFGGPNSRF